METEIEELALPKWPALLVQGKDVTEEQAREIILRTSVGWLDCNDKEWNEIVRNILGKPMKRDYSWDDDTTAAHAKVAHEWADCWPSVRPLYYLTNDRIASSWIGGPKGWIDWQGNIFCNTFNVGKWPGMGGLIDEAAALAEAFPFLEAKFQFLNHESGFTPEDEESLALLTIEFADGEITVDDSVQEPMTVDLGLEPSAIMMRFESASSERGCTEEQLTQAVGELKEKFPNIVDRSDWSPES